MDYGYGMSGNQFYGQMPQNAMPAYQRQAMQPQQMFTQQMQSNVFGKMIQAPTDIMPGDIPMNGTPCFFPMQDGSAIYMKAWSADGTINTMRFLPEHAAPKEPTQLDRIENMLKRYFEEQSLPPVKIEVDNE